jgi:hypothetical protein
MSPKQVKFPALEAALLSSFALEARVRRARLEEQCNSVGKVGPEPRQFAFVPFVTFQVGRLLHFDDDQVLIGSTMVNDDVREDRGSVMSSLRTLRLEGRFSRFVS